MSQSTALTTFANLGIAGLNLDATLSKDDLTAISINQYEERLLAQDKALEAQIKDVQKEQVEVQKHLNKLVQDAGAAAVKTKLATLEKALRAFESARKYKVEVATAVLADKKIVVSVGVVGVYHLNLSESIKIPEAIRKVQQEAAELGNQLQDLSKQRIEVRTSLAQVNRLERKAKAALARTVLSRTDEGQALLKQLEGIEALPGMVGIEGKVIEG